MQFLKMLRSESELYALIQIDQLLNKTKTYRATLETRKNHSKNNKVVKQTLPSILGMATFSNEFKSTEYGPTLGLLFWVALGSSSLKQK